MKILIEVEHDGSGDDPRFDVMDAAYHVPGVIRVRDMEITASLRVMPTGYVMPGPLDKPSEPHTVISPWANDQAMREMLCPHCQAKAGEWCRQRSGRKATFLHIDRTRAYREKIGAAEFNLRHQRGYR